MGIFGNRKSARKVQERLDELSEQLDAHGRSIRGLRLEWEETYDKIHRLFGRIAKRTALDSAPVQPPVLEQGANETGIDEISAAIHARRKAGKAP